MKNKLIDIIDFEKVNMLLEGFHKTTGFVTAILDLEGNVLSQSGWRKICTEFHRVHPETSKRCKISDTELAGKINAGQKYHFYTCLNGLVDVAVPIIIKGEHIANLFTGQFFFEAPDKDFFIKQADKYGFNKKGYLTALKDIPVVSEEKVKTAMAFLLNVTEMIVEISQQKLEQIELNDALKKKDNHLQSIFNAMSEGFSIQDVICDDSGKPCDLRFVDANPAFELQTGLKNKDILGHTLLELFPTSEHYWIERYGNVGLTGKPISFEAMFGPLNIHYHVNAFQTKPGQIGTMFTNINERKLAEIRLRDEKEQKRAILEFVGDPIFLKDNHHRFIFVNRAFLDLVDLNIESVIGKTLAENISEIEQNHFVRVDRNVLDTGMPDYREEELTVGGKTHTIITRKNRFVDKSGNRFLVGSIHDITERKKTEEELKFLLKREQFLADIIRNASVAISIGYPDGRLGKCNKAFERLTGYTEEELKEINWTTVLTPKKWLEQELKHLEIIHQTKKSIKYEKEYIHKNGTIIPIELIVNPLFDEAGNATHYYAFITDLTERKKAENELIESKFFFEQLFIQSTTSTQLLDSKGWCVKINPKLSELFGVKPEDIEGGKYNILQDGEIIRTGVIDHLKRVFENKETVRWEVNFDLQYASETTGVPVSKPEKKWFQNLAYPIVNAEGKLIYVIVQHEDITDRKIAELEVISLNAKLEERVKDRTHELSNSQAALLNLVEDLNEKSQELDKNAKLLEAKNKELETFTYSVSHDLKAPLRGIDGYSKLLQDSYKNQLDEEANIFLTNIRESALKMNELINDLLEYSRLERSEIRMGKIKIKQLITSLASIYTKELKSGGFSLDININETKIEADTKGISIALRNLIENSIKFTCEKENPEISISIRENDNAWVLSVKDNGIGFDMKYSTKIFDIFQRLHRIEDYPGTGIGLAMVSKAMHRMNGKVWATSMPGKGSTFYLQIPKTTNYAD